MFQFNRFIVMTLSLGILCLQPALGFSQELTWEEPAAIVENAIYMAEISLINLAESTLTINHVDVTSPDEMNVSTTLQVTGNSEMIINEKVVTLESLTVGMTVDVTFSVDQNGQKILNTLFVIE